MSNCEDKKYNIFLQIYGNIDIQYGNEYNFRTVIITYDFIIPPPSSIIFHFSKYRGGWINSEIIIGNNNLILYEKIDLKISFDSESERMKYKLKMP